MSENDGSSSGADLVCPRCQRELGTGGDSYASPRPGRLPRCPEHGLAFVRREELTDGGSDPMLGVTVADRFTVLGRLGVGSMGSIYRARQEPVGRDVALKIVRRAYDPEARTRFEREARATSALVSPYTVTVFDFGEADGDCWYLALELLEGETLGERLRRETRLGVDESITIARQALSSLSEAHAKGIVHRDLKPDNLFLAELPKATRSGEGEVCKVLDFGIAKVLHEEAPIDQLETQAGTVFGTPRYMSPEQAQGRPLDGRTDIYSLGLLVYQMLAGRAPFVDDDAVVVMARHIENQPPSFAEVAPEADIPPEVERVVRRALAKEPDERYQTAEEFSGELEAALNESGVAGTGAHRISWVGPPASLVAPARSGRVGVRAAVVLAMGAAVAGVSVAVLLVGGQASHSEPGGFGTSPEQAGADGPAAPHGLGRTAGESSAPPGAREDSVPVGQRSGADGGADAAAAGSADAPPPPRAGQATGRHRKAAAPAAPDVRRGPDDRYGRFE